VLQMPTEAYCHLVIENKFFWDFWTRQTRWTLGNLDLTYWTIWTPMHKMNCKCKGCHEMPTTI